MAHKQKFGRNEALELARDANRILVSKGKKLLSFGVASTDDEIAKEILGRSGNLRVPAIRIGDTFMVGFHQEAYADLFE